MRNFLNGVKWWFQRKITGYCDPDYWDPSVAIAKYALPLLRYQCEFSKGSPFRPVDFDSADEWVAAVNKMIFALSYYAGHFECEDIAKFTDKDWEKIKEGRTLFGEHFGSLWN